MMKTVDMFVQQMDHFTLRTDKLDETIQFYTQILGLKRGHRPPFAFAGAWLYGQNQHPLLHLAVWDPNDSALQRYLGERQISAGSGSIDHVALRCKHLPEFEQHLQAHQVVYQGRTVPAVHEHQIFLTDPNGVRIECIFSADEPTSWQVDDQGVWIRAQRRPLVLGQIDLSFHVASSAVVQQLLAQDGVAYELRQAPHEQMYEWLAHGEVDMVVSAWLPGSHGRYVDPLSDELLYLGVLYEPYAIWGVPDYVPEDVLRSVADLRKPEVCARIRQRIQGIGPGAGISRFSHEIIAHYQLDQLGYTFHNGSLDDCVGAFLSAVEQQEWVVIPLWHPQYLHSQHRIRALVEPQGLLRGVDKATLVLRRNAEDLLPQSLIQRLRRIHLGNAAVATLDHNTSCQGMTPLAAAQQWLETHSDLVRTWG